MDSDPKVIVISLLFFAGQVRIPGTKHVKIWRNVRIAHVTGGRQPDLIVVDGIAPSKYTELGDAPFVPPRLLIFKGIPRPPWFNFQVRDEFCVWANWEGNTYLLD